mmetsp:Transcript_47526/g.152689  ORF Transcript_47526/g.152689 Transcript_47526/m.152689 type:complete len:85 (+) Transcript_47526:859-1113(+)
MQMDKCRSHFRRKCGGSCFWGEDMFIDKCLQEVPGSRREDEFRIFLEDHCEHPADAVTCGEYLECLRSGRDAQREVGSLQVVKQ